MDELQEDLTWLERVADAAPAAREATRDFVEGDRSGAFAVLRKRARAAEARAAAYWKQLGALAHGVDTAAEAR